MLLRLFPNTCIGVYIRVVQVLGLREFTWWYATQRVIYPVLLFLLDALLPAIFLAHCAALCTATTVTGANDATVLHAYRLGHWLGCVAYCLGRLAVWGAGYALRRLDSLHQEVRGSDRYLRSERLLNRDEVAVPGVEGAGH